MSSAPPVRCSATHVLSSAAPFICKSNASPLYCNTSPSCCLANNLDWGGVPPELQGMTLMEQRSIGIYNSFTTVVCLGGI